jgi:hypothetical protein
VELEQAEQREGRELLESGGEDDGWRLGQGRLLLRDPVGDAEPRRLRVGRAICSAHTRPVPLWGLVLTCVAVEGVK